MWSETRRRRSACSRSVKIYACVTALHRTIWCVPAQALISSPEVGLHHTMETQSTKSRPATSRVNKPCPRASAISCSFPTASTSLKSVWRVSSPAFQIEFRLKHVFPQRVDRNESVPAVDTSSSGIRARSSNCPSQTSRKSLPPTGQTAKTSVSASSPSSAGLQTLTQRFEAARWVDSLAARIPSSWKTTPTPITWKTPALTVKLKSKRYHYNLGLLTPLKSINDDNYSFHTLWLHSRATMRRISGVRERREQKTWRAVRGGHFHEYDAGRVPDNVFARWKVSFLGFH